MRNFLVVLLLLLVFVFSIHTLTSVNQDIGRHLVLGKLIWETKEIPKTNLFSHTNPDFPFVNHHWLGEVFLYLSSLAVGLKGLIVFKAFSITAAFALAFFSFYRRENIIPAIIAGLISIFILIERTDVRPEIFSFLFLGWYLFVLFRWGRQRAKRASEGGGAPSELILWSLPIIQLVWVNTHIYFFLGPLIFILFLAGNGLLVKSDRLKLIVIGILIFIVNFINPNGLAGMLYPFTVLNDYGYSIVENQGPFFLRDFGYPWLTTWALFAGIIFTALSFMANGRNFKKNIFEFSLFVAAVVLALKMIRNYPIFALTMLPVVLKNFHEAKYSKEEEDRHPIIARTGYNWTSVFLVLLVVLIFSVMTGQIYEEAGLSRRFGLEVPRGAQAAVDFVKENNLKGPIFNNFDVGSFLIWKLPEEKVFIDGRPEAYPADFIQNVYIPMQESPEAWEKYSKEYGINYVFWLYSDITPWSRKFVGSMLQNPNWPLIYRDGSVVIFVRK